MQACHGFLGVSQPFDEHLVAFGLIGTSKLFDRPNQMVFSLLEMVCKLLIGGVLTGFLGKSWQMTLFCPQIGNFLCQKFRDKKVPMNVISVSIRYLFPRARVRRYRY